MVTNKMLSKGHTSILIVPQIRVLRISNNLCNFLNIGKTTIKLKKLNIKSVLSYFNGECLVLFGPGAQ